MRISVIGAGSMGLFIADALAQTKHEVLLVGRPNQVLAVQNAEIMKRTGSRLSKIQVPMSHQLDRECDLVIFAVSYTELEFAYQANHAFLENCYMMSIQPGVQGANILSCHFEPEKIISSLITFKINRDTYSEIFLDHDGQWFIGKPYVANDSETFKIAESLGEVFPTEVSFDISAMQWLRLLWDFRLSLPALINQTQEEVYRDLDFCRLYGMLLSEGFDIVQKGLVPLASLPNMTLALIEKWATTDPQIIAPDIQVYFNQSSGVHGPGILLEQIRRKRSSEIDFINGEVTHAAASMRVQTPLNSKIVRLIHQVEESNVFFSPDAIKKAFGLN